MNFILLFVSLGLIGSSSSYGADFVCTKSKPFQARWIQKAGFSLQVTNVAGPIKVYAKQADGVIDFKASTDSDVPSTVTAGISNDVLKVEAIYPPSTSSGVSQVATNVSGGHSVSMSTVGNKTVVTIDGVVQPDVNSGGKPAPGTVTLSIGVPADLLQDLRLSSTSGDITADKIKTSGSVETNNVAGATKLMSVQARTSKVRSVSGDISTRDGGWDLTLVSVSGDIKVAGQHAARVDANSTSGSITFSNPATERERARSLSGDVTYTER